jgi:type VI protein secretion system component VasF
MAKKVAKKKKSVSRANKGINIEFNSWTFFLFALFVLLAVMILLSQQMRMRLF